MSASLFALPPAPRLRARIDPENLRSVALAERIGMRREAHVVENGWFTGRWSDELRFALLAREWSSTS
ncbi:RimJ/RimL family protein N-acetyltransferase [Microbacterium proteolyticum]|uniref:RimJ/RimL family protein N-acetyltransferase n=1 Tax=Microbacterium proteolyticum TaxID=1572644 RepID=A0A7W5CIL4_9MICO|nr:GNAT family protein [Microbacterium proteolyticum]MBB3158360.1 RimJ/RimL family protein N-acetyltransferase [Microbacterium proteolyticum]